MKPDAGSGGLVASSGGHDLDSRVAIHDLVVEFYREILLDDLLSPVFEEVAEVDWAVHIPRLVDYWCAILLGNEERSGSIMEAHRLLNSATPIKAEHCDRWYQLWTRCVGNGWTGPIADRARTHAASVMKGMAKHVLAEPWEAPEQGSPK